MTMAARIAGVADVLKDIVRRSPLAGPARFLYQRIWPLSVAEQGTRYDLELAAVMARVHAAD